jgi:alpha-amylase
VRALFLLAAFAASATASASPDFRPLGKGSRTVMVQLFEWPWDSVAEECERVLGPAGFAAVQVSPPTEHLNIEGHPWWERYQPVSHRLISRSGTEKQFAQMVKRCRQAGVDVYADVVMNHMTGWSDGGFGFAGSPFSHYEYQGLFSYNDFHHCGRNGTDDIVNFTDLYELLNCELLNLSDLDTGSLSVQKKLALLLKRLTDMGVAGFRVDAAKHMAAGDINSIFAKVGASFYAVHELIVSPGEPVDTGAYLASGDVNVFPYAYAVGKAFLSADLRGLGSIGFGVPSENAVVFLENHDLERRPAEESLVPFLKNPEMNRLASVYLLTYPYGYPQLYSGYSFANYDQGPPLADGKFTSQALRNGQCEAPWTCAHRDPGILELVKFRNATDKVFQATDINSPRPGVLSYGRGRLGHVVINASDREEALSVKTKLAPGYYCGDLGESARCKIEGSVDMQGMLKLRLPAKSAFVTLAK